MLKPRQIAVVGAAESTRMGVVPDVSQLGLNLDAALNAIADAGLTPADIDGVASAGEHPWNVAAMLGIVPRWLDGTSVGGCSYIAHVRHACAAIAAGLCTTVLVTHGESGRSGVGATRYAGNPAGLPGQFEVPYGIAGPVTQFTIPVLRFLKDTGTEVEDLARVASIQREWAAMNPRATLKEPISVEQVMADRMIAYPFRKAMCCVVTDGGGAVVLTTAERARDLPGRAVYILGTGEGIENPIVSMMDDLTRSAAFRLSGRQAFESAGVAHADIDHLMLYDAFAHLPLYMLEDLGFCGRGEAKHVYRDRRAAPGGDLPINTNGGGLSYMHSGMYGMYALQESIRQMRGIAPAQVPGARIGLVHGVGNMFSAAATVIFTNEA